VPGKALKKINGKPLLWHLIERLIPFKLPIILAIPHGEDDYFEATFAKYSQFISRFSGSEKDPLNRMVGAAAAYSLDHVVRVTHDKVFIDHNLFTSMYNEYMKRGLDYGYSSSLSPGTGFEIINFNTLCEASYAYKEVEHISYAIKAITKNSMDIPLRGAPTTSARFLVDFPEDVTFFQTLFACLGNNVGLLGAVEFCHNNPWVTKLNRLPKYTVYTCAYNAEATIAKTIQRVTLQTTFQDTEYILIDDFSNDRTSYIMAEAASTHPNIKYIRNDSNVGLASSSNKALSEARGKYICRIDADDYFARIDAVEDMAREIEGRNLDAVYPGFYDGAIGVVGDAKINNHVGGALFKTRALNHIKFTETLRNYDGYDLYLRAKTQLALGYLKAPYFFYTHNNKSMSKTNLVERAKTKQELEARHGSC